MQLAVKFLKSSLKKRILQSYVITNEVIVVKNDMFSRVEILLSRDWRHFPYEKKKVKYEHENCLLIDMLSKYRFFTIKGRTF